MFVRAIADHIAGMTDQFASREYQKLYLPDYV
jgi:dGTPase